jgi:hypothetical protein
MKWYLGEYRGMRGVVLRFMVMTFPNVHLLVYATPNGYPIARKMYMICKKMSTLHAVFKIRLIYS